MRSMMRDSLLYFFINEILLFIFSLSFLKYNHMLGKKKWKNRVEFPQARYNAQRFYSIIAKKEKKKRKRSKSVNWTRFTHGPRTYKYLLKINHKTRD